MSGIFDKVVSSVNKGVATVGASSKAMVEKAQIRTTISNLEAERKQLAELLGMRLYESVIQGGEAVTDPGMANFITEISKRLEGIAEQEAALQRVEEEVSKVTGAQAAANVGAQNVCPCGHANSIDSKFCVGCGSPL